MSSVFSFLHILIMKINSRGRGTGRGMIWSVMKQPNNDGKCSSLSVEGEDK